MSKTNIDNLIRKNEYRKAFVLLILVLERLNDNEKVEFIDYYSKNLNITVKTLTFLIYILEDLIYSD
jgi:hypothetical protein